MSENSADEIIPNLWLGNSMSALNWVFVCKNKIQYIVNITNDVPCIFNCVKYLQWAIRDQDICGKCLDLVEIIDRIVDFIHYGLRQNMGVLVHCKEGHHRSASMIMAYLIKYHSFSYHQSRQYIRSKRPSALKRTTCVMDGVQSYYLLKRSRV